jgi:diphosphate-dependent phosphofructokinase
LDQGGQALALPLTGLLHQERRHGEDELVIEKALVEVASPAFKYFLAARERWAQEDRFASPGPRQLWGPVSNQMPITVALNQGYARLNFDLGPEIKVVF